MRTTVNVGDLYRLGAHEMLVVEVLRGTDAGGGVSFETAPVFARLRRLPDLPLVVGHDQLFACYLLRARDDPGLYAVGVYHPALGERIAPAEPCAEPFSEELVLCWAPGPVRVLMDGEPVAGETVSLMLERETQDGTALCLLPDKYKRLKWSEEWQALVDSGERDGPYRTDEDGYVYNAVLGEPILFPRGEGAFGQRVEDALYEGAEPPVEYTRRVWLYFRGQRVELREGQPATLDWRTGTIVVTGPAGRWVRVELEGAGEDPACVTCRVTAQIPAPGELTLGGLYPGRYCLSAWKAGGGTGNRDWSEIAPRQWVSVGPGDTAHAAVSFDTAPPGYYLLYVYTAGADTQSGVDVLGLVPPLGYDVLGTTDAAGRVLVPTMPPPMNMLINDGHWGYQQVGGDGPTFEATLAGYMVMAVSLGFGGEAGWWAFPGEGHEHLDAYAPDWTVGIQQTGETFDCGAIPIGARTVEPVPHLPPGIVEGWTFTPPDATYDINLLDAGGEPVTVLLQSETPVVRDGTDASTLILQVLGGRAWGNVLGHDPGSSTEPALPEAARLGLEHGYLLPALVQRYVREGGPALEGRLGWVCPYCLCMAVIWPGPGWGHCPQCAADARSYLHGPPASEGRWRVRHIALGPNRGRVQVLSDNWYRPLEYAEDDGYLGMYHGLPRWVCRHPVLGEWRAGEWIEGADAQALEAQWGVGGERLLLRPKLQLAGQIAGDATYRLRYRTDGGELRSLDFDLRAGEAGIRLLSSLAPVWAEARDPAEVLYVRGVTSVSLLAPAEDPGNRFHVVGDVPSLVVARLPVRRAWATPFALQLGALERAAGPDLRLTPDGRLFVAYVNRGDVYAMQRPSPQRPWDVPVRVTDGGHYTDPSITILPTGVLVLVYTAVDTGDQHIATSCDDGETWETVR